jgi:hypothetical protein
MWLYLSTLFVAHKWAKVHFTGPPWRESKSWETVATGMEGGRSLEVLESNQAVTYDPRVGGKKKWVMNLGEIPWSSSTSTKTQSFQSVSIEDKLQIWLQFLLMVDQATGGPSHSIQYVQSVVRLALVVCMEACLGLWDWQKVFSLTSTL